MPDRHDLTAPWAASAAYLYTLDLDDSALAWEYLRRKPEYHAEWQAFGVEADVERWGLR